VLVGSDNTEDGAARGGGIVDVFACAIEQLKFGLV
jgi:hypothetical protein